MKKDGIGLIPASQVGSVFNEALDPPFSCQRPLFDILTVLAYSFYVAALGLSERRTPALGILTGPYAYGAF